MAKAYIGSEIESSKIMSFDKTFDRLYGQMFDNTTTYTSLSAAQTYAATDKAYVGQELIVLTISGTTVTGMSLYKIKDTAGNLEEIYTKTTIDSKLNSKANLASPTFTGSPKAPKPAAGDNSTRIATTSFVNEALTNMFTQLEIVKIVTNVSEVTQPNILYLIPGSITGTDDLYDEYVFANNKAEKIGSVGAGTAIDGYNEDYTLDNYDNYVNPTLEDGSTNTSYVGNRIPSVKFVQQAIDTTLSEVNTILAGLVDGTL